MSDDAPTRAWRPGVSRRALAGLMLGGAAGLRGAAARSLEASDRGLGGTGAVPGDPGAETLGQDRGIGGTGVIGTIRRFGSIVVNDLRVTFPPDVAVTIDGRPTTARALKLGHVVRVLARPRRGTLVTRAIVALSEVVGPVERVEGRGLVVLGQRVEPADAATALDFPRGTLVAVSGLRRLDGVIVASLVERRPGGPFRLHGPVRAGADGLPAIGGLSVAGLAPALVGRRVGLVGLRRGGRFVATSVSIEPSVPFADAEHLSVEAYVARAPDGLQLGSGLDLAADDAAVAAVAGSEPVRAVILARPGPDGRFGVDSVRIEHDGRASAHGGDRPGGVDGPGRPSAPGGAGRPGGAPGPDGGGARANAGGGAPSGGGPASGGGRSGGGGPGGGGGGPGH